VVMSPILESRRPINGISTKRTTKFSLLLRFAWCGWFVGSVVTQETAISRLLTSWRHIKDDKMTTKGG